MTCRRLSDLLLEYTSGELPRRQRIGVALHLLACVACRIYASSYRATTELARACPEERVTDGEVEHLLRGVLAHAPVRPTERAPGC
ncbi:MAG: zf-HC2 domain-containing protein [Myxococcota bacterium]